MAIQHPIKKSLGADVHNFPKAQFDKIVEIIDALNDILDGSFTMEDLTLTGDLIVGDDATIIGDLFVDTISERTLDAGVTIEGVLLKDGQVYTGSVPSYSLGTGSEFVVLAGDDLVDTAPQFFTTGDVGYITTETGTQTFGTGSLRTGATVVTAASSVASLKATLIVLSGTDITASAATLETFNNGYGAGVFVPGIYTTASAIGVSAAATITLSGDGDYVFKSTGGALTFGAGVTIVLTNGAKASRVFWVASTDLSTTGATSSLKGNFLTRDITVASTNNIEGRMLASRDVTIDGTATNMYLPLA